MNLSGKSVIVTGAGRGIGKVIAAKCASQGATVILLGRTLSELQEAQSEVEKLGGGSYVKVCDISDERSVEEAVSFALEKCNSLDVLVNNAGVQPPIGPFSETGAAAWKKNIEINLFGAIHCTREVLPEMLQRRKGKIINISGGGSTSARPNFTAYAVSKTALVRFTETLAIELKGLNIDVNAISPGAINTRMLDEVIQAGELSGDELAAASKRKLNGGDNPEAAADLVAFLASDASDGITGKLISAKWDPWREKAFQERLRSEKDLATLRRIDDSTYGSIK